MRLQVTLLALLVSVAATASWTAEAARHVLVPESIAVWNAEDGLIGSGGYCEFANCAGSIAVTNDGGRTSRTVLRTAKSVEWVTVADDVAWATAGSACSGATTAAKPGGRSATASQSPALRTR